MGVQLDASGGGGKKRVTPNINVTPLVDVVLVLLIIFMLVIPNMQEGVKIDLFAANNADKDDEDAEPIVVSVARVQAQAQAQAQAGSGAVSYHLGEDEYSRDAMISELGQRHEAEPDRPLLFRGDSQIPYGQIRDVFHECQGLGFSFIQLAVGAQKEGWEE